MGCPNKYIIEWATCPECWDSKVGLSQILVNKNDMKKSEATPTRLFSFACLELDMSR